jgi:plasmid stability protein
MEKIMTDTVPVQLRLPVDLRNTLRARADQHGTTMTRLMVAALRQAFNAPAPEEKALAVGKTESAPGP